MVKYLIATAVLYLVGVMFNSEDFNHIPFCWQTCLAPELARG